MTDNCVICGAVIPEGGLICPNCRVKFPAGCTNKCPYFKTYQSSIVDVHCYCELMDIWCDADSRYEYFCPLVRR